MNQTTPTRILVTHRGILTQRDEVADVCQMVLGALESTDPAQLEIDLTDGRWLYRATVQRGELTPVPIRSFRAALTRRRYDIVLVHEPVPMMHLWLAIALRLRGTSVVHQPITMLTHEYARGTWFAERSTLFRRLKPLVVAAMRRAWLVVADGFVCVSEYEIAQSGLPRERCRVLRWPLPTSPLAKAIADANTVAPPATSGAPVAFVNRFDWHRKGFDRLCEWLETYRDVLPQPAVILLAPTPEKTPARLSRLVDDGLIDWRPDVGGADLLPHLRQSRGVMLLSRWDGQSRILREAAALGLPTISTPDSHFSEIVTRLNRGHIVDGDDPHAIHRAFQSLSTADALESTNAPKLFDRGEVGTELIEHLSSLTASGAGEPPC